MEFVDSKSLYQLRLGTKGKFFKIGCFIMIAPEDITMDPDVACFAGTGTQGIDACECRPCGGCAL